MKELKSAESGSKHAIEIKRVSGSGAARNPTSGSQLSSPLSLQLRTQSGSLSGAPSGAPLGSPLSSPLSSTLSPPSGSQLGSLLAHVKDEMASKLDLNRDMDDDEVLNAIEDVVSQISHTRYISLADRKRLAERAFNSLRGLDVIQPLVDDPKVSEIMVNGLRDIFVEMEGKVVKTDLAFESIQKLEDVIQSIVTKVNRTVNEASPIVDARLADGSRINAVLKPVAIDGPVLTIRKFPDKPMSIERLLAFGSLDSNIADLLRALIRGRYNMFISGGTGSGKTSLLNAIAAYIPGDERVITIEDSAELQLKSLKNLVRLETRNANTEGKGQIDIGSLIKSSLRMRPDRIIVGEVRDGPAAYYMLQSMNTGHDGSLTTGHANSAEDMLSRLETMALSEEAVPLEAIRRQIASAIDVIVHVARFQDGSRKVVEITELDDMKNGEIVLNRIFVYSGPGCDENEETGCFRYTGNKIRNISKLSLAGIRSEYFESQ